MASWNLEELCGRYPHWFAHAKNTFINVQIDNLHSSRRERSAPAAFKARNWDHDEYVDKPPQYWAIIFHRHGQRPAITNGEEERGRVTPSGSDQVPDQLAVSQDVAVETDAVVSSPPQPVKKNRRRKKRGKAGFENTRDANPTQEEIQASTPKNLTGDPGAQSTQEELRAPTMRTECAAPAATDRELAAQVISRMRKNPLVALDERSAGKVSVEVDQEVSSREEHAEDIGAEKREQDIAVDTNVVAACAAALTRNQRKRINRKARKQGKKDLCRSTSGSRDKDVDSPVSGASTEADGFHGSTTSSGSDDGNNGLNAASAAKIESPLLPVHRASVVDAPPMPPPRREPSETDRELAAQVVSRIQRNLLQSLVNRVAQGASAAQNEAAEDASGGESTKKKRNEELSEEPAIAQPTLMMATETARERKWDFLQVLYNQKKVSSEPVVELEAPVRDAEDEPAALVSERASRDIVQSLCGAKDGEGHAPGAAVKAEKAVEGEEPCQAAPRRVKARGAEKSRRGGR